MHAAKSSDYEGGIKRSRKSFPRDVAEIYANGIVAQREIIQKVAADFVHRTQPVSECDFPDLEKLRREHCALERAGFVKFLFAENFERG
jgi:hypothetical protein